jgi:hypothetical protein
VSKDIEDRPMLPAERAFVVWLRADCQPAEHDVRGRVEHVRSGDLVHFDSLAELLAFLARLTSPNGAAS